MGILDDNKFWTGLEKLSFSINIFITFIAITNIEMEEMVTLNIM